MKLVVDPGHGGTDPGGRSLGTPEKAIALAWAADLYRVAKARGHDAVMTRAVDEAVPLSERAAIANRTGADLFVSVHANASDNPAARGAWTIYAAPSTRGQEIARTVQRAVSRIVGVNSEAAYPDGSTWVGGRTLAVLRQTRMPAILLELGFMTNPDDLALLESPSIRAEGAVAIMAAIEVAMGERSAVPAPSGELAVEAREPVETPPNLDKIYALTPPVMREVARVRRLDPERVMDYAEAFEAALRIMDRSGVKHAKRAADLLAFGIHMRGDQ